MEASPYPHRFLPLHTVSHRLFPSHIIPPAAMVIHRLHHRTTLLNSREEMIRDSRFTRNNKDSIPLPTINKIEEGTVRLDHLHREDTVFRHHSDLPLLPWPVLVLLQVKDLNSQITIRQVLDQGSIPDRDRVRIVSLRMGLLHRVLVVFLLMVLPVDQCRCNLNNSHRTHTHGVCL